ncbi:10653_t:CDS:2 [Diversispora eburnea]|uniref:10653_t:CDS:1 n=1 Tax=Diversispora eburnea TaxID=1213867 RepID=A0A9N9G7N7_9GLOM|nr:10653_t:CDS:2 [Diversispora eburnea]
MTQLNYKREFAPRRLAFWIFWFGSHITLFLYGYYKQKNDVELNKLNVIGRSIWISRGAGLCLAYDGSLILLPVCRNLLKNLRVFKSLNYIIPFDENIWFHRQTSYAMLIFTLIHVFAHYINFWKLQELGIYNAWSIHYKTWAGLTGHIMLLIMVLIYTSSHAKMRNQSFETFWYTHNLSFFFMLCLYFHGYGCFVKTAEGKCKGYNSWRFTLISGFIYFSERVLRVIRARQETQITKVIDHPLKIIEIQFNKPSFRYKAGQYLFLNVPAISKWQWHPFTITSAPDDPYVSVHVRQIGDFTNKLGDLLGCNKDKGMPPSINLPTLKIDGSYGAPAVDVFDNKIAILIGCGIGVTPFASILRNIWYQQKNGKSSQLKRVEFIWICQDIGSFEWFQSLLKTLEDTMPQGFLKFHIYLTSRLRESIIQNIMINEFSSFDPLTNLGSRTHYGRPNFDELFDRLKSSINSKDSEIKIGVYYCGPNSLAKKLKRVCKKANSDGITTKRPDGTLRKERRVRPGFTPQEDIARYKNPNILEPVVKIKALEKKTRQIDRIKEKENKGESLTKEEENKLNNLDQVKKELENLQKLKAEEV